MIVLIQKLDADSNRWDDLRVPRRQGVAPDKGGNRTPVTTVEEFAAQLVATELVGEYRVVLDSGEIWRVSIIRQDQFIAKMKQERPV